MRKGRFPLAHWPLQAQVMQPAPSAADWPVQPLADVAALAEWFSVDVPTLEWFADAKGLSRKQFGTRLHHYHYKVLQKRSGGIRIIEAPKERLKTIQRKVLTDMLEHIPPYYSAAHACRRSFARWGIRKQ